MSDTSQGPGWWQASDGKWYAPQPSATPQADSVPPQPATVAPALGSDTSQGPGWWQASDGRWYAPQPQQAPASAPVVGDVPPQPGWWRATDGNWYPPQAPPGQAPKKPVYKRVWFWLLVIVALGIGGCVTILSVATTAVNKAITTNHTVVYSVTGSGTADITYDSFTNGNSGSAQDNGAALPWSKTVNGSGIFNVYSLSAQAQTGTSISCTITVDGKQVANHTSTGQYAVVACSGSAS